MATDPHGRADRAGGDHRRRPADGFRVRDGGRFGELVRAGIGDLPAPLRRPLRGARLLVEDVPPGSQEGDIPLARYERTADGRATLTVYRRPLELRAFDRADLVDLIGLAAGRAVADALGLAGPDEP